MCVSLVLKKGKKVKGCLTPTNSENNETYKKLQTCETKRM